MLLDRIYLRKPEPDDHSTIFIFQILLDTSSKYGPNNSYKSYDYILNFSKFLLYIWDTALFLTFLFAQHQINSFSTTLYNYTLCETIHIKDTMIFHIFHNLIYYPLFHFYPKCYRKSYKADNLFSVYSGLCVF